jgi:hypothetical protein
MLLEDWWFNVGGSYGFPDIYPRYFNTLDPVLASYYQLATPWVATGDFEVEVEFSTTSADAQGFISAVTDNTGYLRILNGYLRIQGDTAIPLSDSTIQFNDGKLHVAKVVSNAVATSIYVDGALLVTGDSVGAFSVGYIGKYFAGYFNSIIANPIFRDLTTPSNTQTYKLDRPTGDIELSQEGNNTLNYVNIPESNRDLYSLDAAEGEWLEGGVREYTLGSSAYVQLLNCELAIGDVLSVVTSFPTSNVAAQALIASSVTVGSTSVFAIDTTGLIVINSPFTSNSVKIDGAAFISGDAYPIDGLSHTIVITAVVTTPIVRIGTNWNEANGWSNVVKNLRVTRANPSEAFPDLFYPINDGFKNDPVIAQTVKHSHKTDGTESYEVGGGFLDYETEGEEYTWDGVDDAATIPVWTATNAEISFTANVADILTRHAVISYGNDSWIRFNTDGTISSKSQGITTKIFGVANDWGTAGEIDVLLKHNSATLSTEILIDGVSLGVLELPAVRTLTYTDLGHKEGGDEMKGVLKNLRLKDLDGIAPERFYPLGNGSTTELTETLGDGSLSGTLVGFDVANWNDIGVAPQYAGIAAYDTLAERAALAGTTEQVEAVNSCAEGDVRNGDFRFGLNLWSISGEDATHTVTLESGGARYVSDTTSPQLSMSQATILTIGDEYTLSIKTIDLVSGSLKSDSFGGAVITGSSGEVVEFNALATTSSLSITRNEANVDVLIDNISIRKASSEQVLKDTVMDGTAVNFDVDNWSILEIA